jgi:hypothetical protein
MLPVVVGSCSLSTKLIEVFVGLGDGGRNRGRDGCRMVKAVIANVRAGLLAVPWRWRTALLTAPWR